MMEDFEKREEIERKLNYLLENYDNDTILNSFENGLYNDILEFYSHGVIWDREKLINFITEKKLEYARKKEELVKKKEQEIIINQNLQKQLEENNQEIVKENNEKEKKIQEEKQKQNQENLLSNNQEKEKSKQQKNDQKQEQTGQQEGSTETSKEDELVKIDDVKESTLTEIPAQNLTFEDTQDKLKPNISDVGDKKYSDEIEKTQTRIKEYEKTEDIEQPELVSKLEIIKRKAIMDAYDKYLSEKRHELNKLINTYNTINSEYNENYDVEEVKEMIQEIEDILIKVKNLKRKLSFSDISSEENKKIYDISNGIEIDFFKKDKKLGEKFRKDYGFTKDDKIVMGIGLYIERKGIVDFVELAKRLPEYKFIWFGYSPLAAATKPVRKAVNTKLDNLFFPGYVERDVIKGAMSGADLYIFPTFEETEGIPIIEACACKQNAIVRDIPIFDGWLEDGKNVYKAKDVDEFEKKIKMFFDGELPSVVDEAYKVAVERDLKTVGKKLKQVYTDVMKM